MKAGKSSQALAHFDNAIKLDRYCHDAFTAKGAALANNGRLMQAIKCFQVRVYVLVGVQGQGVDDRWRCWLCLIITTCA